MTDPTGIASDPLKQAVAVAVAQDPALNVSPERAAQSVAAQVKADPVLQNALSQEPWYQSRVANYGSAVTLVSFFALIQQAVAHGLAVDQWDRVETAFNVMTLWGGLGVVYGRFTHGLKPMWHRLLGGQ